MAKADVTCLRNADKFAETAASYKVDVSKHPMAKENLKVTTTPTILVYKDGNQLKKVEGLDEAKMEEVKKILTA